MAIKLTLKNKPIILKYAKQGMPGRTGAQGLPGEDAINWEAVIKMEGYPSGTGTITLYKDGAVADQEIHYAEIYVLPVNSTGYIRSNELSRTISGTYIFQYENIRGLLALIWEDSSQEKVLCADAIQNFRGRDVKTLQCPALAFTTAQWQAYGAAGTSRTWTTGAGYDNSQLENGDLVLISGAVSDQRDQQDQPVQGFILGAAVIPDGGNAEESVQVVSHAFFIGPAGAAATIQVGSVTTLAPGSPATVVNSGTPNNARFDFGIPKGEKGDMGDLELPVSIANGGTGASTAADARAALGAVAVAGDTMTGDLLIRSDNIDEDGGAPAADAFGQGLELVDKDGAALAFIEPYHDASGAIALRLGVFRSVSGADCWNRIDFRIAEDGTRSYLISHPAEFRAALGLGDVATQSTVPVANGGTGADNAADARTNLGITDIAARENYTISTTDLTAGTSALTSGKLYFVYE